MAAMWPRMSYSKMLLMCLYLSLLSIVRNPDLELRKNILLKKDTKAADTGTVPFLYNLHTKMHF